MASSKIALVTGFSRGLGRSTALHLARDGVGVIGTYNSNAAAADDVVAELKAAGVEAVALQLDVTDTGSFAAFRERVETELRDTFGAERLDFLVNNAGTGLNAPVVETTEAQFDQMVAEHFKAPFFLTQTLLPVLADGGRIVNISTGLTRFTNPGFGAYAGAKIAGEELTRTLAKELGDRQIRVNSVAPGATATDFAGGAVRDIKEMNDHIASATAAGRVGEADDIGAGVAAVLSDGFAWANGTRIELSGGQQL